ncbi:MAG: helix-turn-helix domain-containing protein [Candidatus Bathyarchaeia archaeon]|nr:helix-turn-helix domain-containing protein [Candidatus Bathyarchaeota archaeon]
MAYRDDSAVKATEAMLKEAGFETSCIYNSGPSCFDVAARRKETLLFIKVQPDIGSIIPQDSLELRLISENINAVSLLISERTRDKPLEDDTVYSRFSVLAITLKTLRNVLRGIHPLVQAGPGGYYVEIDGEAVKRRREELGYSIGEVAEKVGISRRTMYSYEQGTAKASVTVAYKLIKVLGIPVAKPINVFATQEKIGERQAHARRIIVKNRFVRKIFRKLLDYDFVTIRKMPFDFVIKIPEDETHIVGGVINENIGDSIQRVEEILRLSKVVQAKPVIVTEDGRKPTNEDIPCIARDEFSKISRPEDLYKL